MCCENEALMEEMLAKVIEEHKDMPGALIPVLHEAHKLLHTHYVNRRDD